MPRTLGENRPACLSMTRLTETRLGTVPRHGPARHGCPSQVWGLSPDAAGDDTAARALSTRSRLERQRDLREPVRVVEIAAVQLREPDSGELARDHRRQRAQPLGDARDEPQRRDAARRARRRGRRSRSACAPRSARPRDRGLHALERRARGRDRDHRPAGADRRDGAVHQVGGRPRLEEQAGELADLQRDLERRAVVDPARDDRPAVDAGELVEPGRVLERQRRAGRRSGRGISSSSRRAPRRRGRPRRRAARPRRAS